MMVAQSADGLPQLVLGGAAEDFGRLTLAAAGVLEEKPSAPGAVVRAAKEEMECDDLIGETKGRQLVKDGLAVVESDWPVGLSRHQGTSWEGADGAKDYTPVEVTQSAKSLLTGF
jgi:hypothetical protein